MSGILYLIPTPIGNLKEVSPRMIETINECSFIACEDTRNTLKLLNLLGIKKKLVSCHEHNETEIAENIIIPALKNGENVGYMSDAGYPCISDPGHIITKTAINNNIIVTPISGPNAFLNALVGSGLNTEHFLFYGFLNAKINKRKSELETLKNNPNTLIFYEAPHRIKETLNDLYEVLGDRKIVIARELTKLHEEFTRSTLKEITKSDKEFIGELVLIVEGFKETEQNIEDEKIIKAINSLIEKGLSPKDAIISVSTLMNLNKNKIYSIYNKK